MKKYIFLALFITLSGVTLKLLAAEPKLPSFSSDKIPPFISGGGVRSIADSLTPNRALIYEANPIFEWKQPVCTKKSPCTLVIERPFQNKIEEDIIFERENIISNSFELTNTMAKLKPGTVYIFSLTGSEGIDNLTLVFYKLSEDEKKQITAKIKSIKDTDSYNKNKARLDIFINQAIWFDTIKTLHSMIDKYGQKEELTSLKKSLYKEYSSNN